MLLCLFSYCFVIRVARSCVMFLYLFIYLAIIVYYTLLCFSKKNVSLDDYEDGVQPFILQLLMIE